MKNREILFRGKRIDNNEWIQGYYVFDYLGHQIVYKDGSCFNIIYETLGQFTGVIDNNRQNIFENDFDSDGNCVIWCNNCNGWEFAAIDIPTKDICISCHRCDGNFLFEDKINDFEIIGNIHDNHELL